MPDEETTGELDRKNEGEETEILGEYKDIRIQLSTIH